MLTEAQQKGQRRCITTEAFRINESVSATNFITMSRACAKCLQGDSAALCNPDTQGWHQRKAVKREVSDRLK